MIYMVQIGDMFIPFRFGCWKYTKQFEHYLCHVIMAPYSVYESLGAGGFTLTREEERIKDEILTNFHHWANQ